MNDTSAPLAARSAKTRGVAAAYHPQPSVAVLCSELLHCFNSVLVALAPRSHAKSLSTSMLFN